jgi:pimeloyl-ACP methyl ester carboxylesterase
VSKKVFVHGVPDTARLWNPILSNLTDVDATCVKLPGFDAPVPEGFDATKEAYVDWLVATIEAMAEPVDLVGHDWGALLVQRVPALRPDLLRTWACGDGPVDAEYVWHDTAQLWQTPEVGEQVMDAFQPELVPELMAPEGIPVETGREMATYIDATMKECILRLYRSAVNVGAEWEPDMKNAATVPALVIWGRDDPYVDVRFAERLASRVDAELVVLDTRHWWPVQAPAEAAAALTAFWNSQ